ncbi:BAG family molecular chaperone regulator 5-mitochondrial [Striga hermonthica]|uniref:BAG family molecular chaperone regulator 5-mitochondrial n=1 Tax=Striga hermonthica TaxID=68872 RepID=A0A9N7N1U7_STRHE|nr:BAG family molecular chaperone regulator 5-mitochondrial [Striga hermonthica]
MENPFFADGRWYQQPYRRYPFSPSPSFDGVPGHQFDPLETQVAGRAAQRQPKEAKVVRIPVLQVDRSGSSAVKIQKVVRGFLVRKCLKKIKDIKREVDEIEWRLSWVEVVDLVKRDEKERLRMTESLMSLLLKLDSICGVDFGVRGCRKAVIRKAIALQERIDAIVAAAVDPEAESDGVDSEEIIDALLLKPKDTSESAISGSQVELCEEVWRNNDRKMDIVGDSSVIDVVVEREVNVVSESDPVGIDNEDDDIVEKSDSLVENWKQGNGKDEYKGHDGDKSDRELLERMIEDNEKMMSMMKQLFERNEMQKKLINSLTNRVEMLEKARLRKKKKKKASANACQDD